MYMSIVRHLPVPTSVSPSAPQTCVCVHVWSYARRCTSRQIRCRHRRRLHPRPLLPRLRPRRLRRHIHRWPACASPMGACNYRRGCKLRPRWRLPRQVGTPWVAPMLPRRRRRLQCPSAGAASRGALPSPLEYRSAQTGGACRAAPRRESRENNNHSHKPHQGPPIRRGSIAVVYIFLQAL